MKHLREINQFSYFSNTWSTYFGSGLWRVIRTTCSTLKICGQQWPFANKADWYSAQSFAASLHYFFKDWNLFPSTLPRNTRSALAFFMDDLIDSISSLFMLSYSYANVFFFYWRFNSKYNPYYPIISQCTYTVFFNHNINFVIFVRDAGEDAHSGCIAFTLLWLLLLPRRDFAEKAKTRGGTLLTSNSRLY